MTDRKVYAKKTHYDWGLFWFLAIIFAMIHIGMVLLPELMQRLLLAIIDLIICLLLSVGIVVQTSTEKEVEIGYIKEAKR